MIAGLHALQAGLDFGLEVVDVDSDDRLVVRFGEDVPVLVHAQRELCRHVLNAARVTDYLTQIG